MKFVCEICVWKRSSIKVTSVENIVRKYCHHLLTLKLYYIHSMKVSVVQHSFLHFVEERKFVKTGRLANNNTIFFFSGVTSAVFQVVYLFPLSRCIIVMHFLCEYVVKSVKQKQMSHWIKAHWNLLNFLPTNRSRMELDMTKD